MFLSNLTEFRRYASAVTLTELFIISIHVPKSVVITFPVYCAISLGEINHQSLSGSSARWFSLFCSLGFLFCFQLDLFNWCHSSESFLLYFEPYSVFGFTFCEGEDPSNSATPANASLTPSQVFALGLGATGTLGALQAVHQIVPTVESILRNPSPGNLVKHLTAPVKTIALVVTTAAIAFTGESIAEYLHNIKAVATNSSISCEDPGTSYENLTEKDPRTHEVLPNYKDSVEYKEFLRYQKSTLAPPAETPSSRE